MSTTKFKSLFFLNLAITCQKPRLAGTHLSVNPMKNSYAYMEVITYSCYEGYQLSGSTSETCGNNGHFQGRLPNCTGWIFSSLLELYMICSKYTFYVYISFVFV